MEKENKKEKKFVDFLKTKEGKKLMKPSENYGKEIKKSIKPFIDSSKKINESIKTLVKGLQKKFEIESKKQPFIHTEQNEKMIVQTKKLGDIMDKFSRRSNIHNVLMLIFTGLLIVLTVILITQVNYYEEERKTQEINKLRSELQSLDLELRYNEDSLIEFRTGLENQSNYASYITENLRGQIANPNIRNETLKSHMIGLYLNFLQANSLLESRNSPELMMDVLNNSKLARETLYHYSNSYLDWEKGIDLEKRIRRLRDLIPSYFECVEQSRTFDKC